MKTDMLRFERIDYLNGFTITLRSDRTNNYAEIEAAVMAFLSEICESGVVDCGPSMKQTAPQFEAFMRSIGADEPPHL